ncbi:hypothetical protein H6F67_10965 [Microcoleus sp. FACHB-1515]|uniref:hypothetical protein n=1 Tax=Cyanophyceae TaxID=3028117 RepID=UPI001689DC45|nr:hypothetical protein [Microcoleus sp. FACHB-1515]MBD2090375.1 hypothetical protein [Microcoleus sp. FACHB-1515]
MSLISITRNALQSQTVRNLIGERAIDILADLALPETEEQDENQNPITRWLGGLAKRLPGFLLNIVERAVSWLLSNAWSVIVEAAFTIVNFDWNQTDTALRAAITANNVQIAGALGQALGTGSVWLVSIALATGATLKFPVLGGKVALALAEEGGEEIRGQVVSLLNTTRGALARNAVLGTMLTLRRLRLFGLAPITEQREPWSIASAVEERIERIGNEALRAFAENFIEGAVDAIIEVGYVVSYAIDDFYSTSRLANETMFGEDRTVKVIPDRNNEEEFITIRGPQQLLKQNVQTALTAHRWVHNRDLGQLVGQPAEDWVQAGMQRRKLTIVFKSKEAPPWIAAPGQPRVKEVTYTIPEPELGLTWQKIKTAAKHYTWGKFRATANLNNGRQMAVYGATEAEAERKLRELLELSQGELLTLSVSEEKDRHPNLRKEAREMYPAYATLLIRRSTAEITGTNDLSGNNYAEELRRIELWPDQEPPNTPALQ